jgi:hypothetical protein
VTIQVHRPLDAPLDLQVVRSADERLSPDDSFLASLPISRDRDGRPIGEPGTHEVLLPLPDSLHLIPARPFVLVNTAHQADPSPDAALTDATPPRVPASALQLRTLGVVIHGGLQPRSPNTPIWTRKFARALRDQGYDTAFPYGWAADSSTPGKAIQQVPRLVRLIRQAVADMPGDGPVQLHLIGHSQGAGIAAQTMRALQHDPPERLAKGYWKLTLLDPHAANTAAPGTQYSTVGGLLGTLGRAVIDSYKADADDPLIAIPPRVDEAEVFYQHTPVSLDPDHDELYNLFGQVPVFGTARYYELNGPMIMHSGGSGVPSWYFSHVIPTLRDGTPPPNPGLLDARRLNPSGQPGDPSPLDAQPRITGRAAPSARVTLYAQRLDQPGPLSQIAETRADAQGRFNLAARTLPPGHYRLILRAAAPVGERWGGSRIFPTIRLGHVLSLPEGATRSFQSAQHTLIRFNRRVAGRNITGMLNTDQPQTHLKPAQRVRLKQLRASSPQSDHAGTP